MRKRNWFYSCVIALAGCAPSSGDQDASVDPDAAMVAGAEDCIPQMPAVPAGAEVQIAPDFVDHYKIFDLGEPGIPNPLGGSTVKAGDDNTLLIAGSSESESGGIYEVAIERGPCGHILGFAGSPSRIADTPFIDANMVYTSSGSLLYC